MMNCVRPFSQYNVFRLDEKSTSAYREIKEPFDFSAGGVLDGVWPSSQEAFDSSILVGPFDGIATGAGNPHTLRIAIHIESYTCEDPPSVIGDRMNVTGDLGSTMSFTRSGPVFTSDDENFIAASSVDGDIDLDGTWTGTPVSAPEPTSPLLSVAVLLTLAGLRRLH